MKKKWHSWEEHPAHVLIENEDENWSVKIMRIKEAVVQALHKTSRTRPPEPAPGLISPQGAASHG